MSVKEFLKPSKRKFLTAFLFLVVSIVLIFWELIPFRSVQILTLVIFIIFAYPFGCYMGKSKKWFIWLIVVVLYFGTLIATSEIIVYTIRIYNNAYGFSCDTDSDCFYGCGTGAVNNRYVALIDPQKHISCAINWAICENNRCEIYSKEKAFIEYCERRVKDFVKQICYEDLAKKIEMEAKKLNDISICDQIEDEEHRADCKREVEEG